MKEEGSRIANEIMRDYKIQKKYEEIAKRKWENARNQRKTEKTEEK